MAASIASGQNLTLGTHGYNGGFRPKSGHYAATKIVYSKDENGRRVRAEAPRMVCRGWADANGVVLFQLRYGSKPLALANGMTAIEVGKLDALPAIIDTLIEATHGGEFDQQLAAAAAERRANFKGRAS